jgi:ElaB/YqjD/DUF883 family membrane-anchored ribosome-binding protein
VAIGQQTGASDGDAGGQAQSTAQDVAGQAQQMAQDAARQAQQQARNAAGQMREQVRTQVDQRSTDVGRQVSGHADDLRTVAEQLREQGKDKPAQLAEQAADRVERIASYMSEADADRMLRDAESFARQRPWAVIAGGMALGLAASRFIKASSVERYQAGGERPTTPPQLPATTTYGEPTASTPPTGHPAGTGAL